MLAVVVAHDGDRWLATALRALRAQTYPALDVVAVDNGSTDGSRELLLDALGPDRVLVAGSDLGFPAAVSMALDSAVASASDPEWLLFVHDDLWLEPDAVRHLVEHAAADPRLAAVGPKLLAADDARILQQVGWSIDLTGRADSGLEEDELDQGQRDRPRPMLYVSTAGMLVRRSAFEAVGRLDRRYHVMRDDLDLCWRLWLAGHEVEVAPQAVGRHVRATANYVRTAGAIERGARYYAERNTLATLLKNYGALSLALVVPLYALVGVARLLGFVATRRVGDAVQTARAWGWNLAHLRETRRLREAVQATRSRTDGELRPLFARTTPKLRAYAEAIVDAIAGGDLEVPLPAEEEAEGRPGLIRRLGAHPVLVVGVTLLAVALVAAVPLLGSGPLRGGDFAPWPDDVTAFLRVYASGWNDAGGTGSPAPPSPAQALLGFWGIAAVGSAWLASRLLLLGALPLAWLLSLRAARIISPRPWPRVAAATMFVLSPPALAALTTGRLGALVTAIALPVLAVAGARLGDPRTDAPAAWRATAVGAIVGAVAVAFEPPTAVLLALAAAVGLVAVAGTPAPGRARRSAAARILTAVVGVGLLLTPWSFTLLRGGAPLAGGFSPPLAEAEPFWRWLLLVPDLTGFPGEVVGIAFPAAGLLGLLLGFPRRPLLVGTLWSVILLSVLTAWGLGRAGDAAVAWPGLPLVLAAAAYAGLLAAALGSAEEVLAEHAFGWRQLVSLATAVAVGIGALGAVRDLLDDPWDAFAVGTPALPAFIGAEETGPFRVLVLAHRDGEVAWDVTGPDGPTMLRYGAPRATALVHLVDDAVGDVVTGASPAAAARLGLANVRYVHVPEGGRSEDLEAALGAQFDLEPVPVERGLVFRVRRWLPRAAYVSSADALATARRGELPPDAEPLELDPVGDDTYRGRAPAAGSVLLAEVADPGWVAEADGARLERTVDQGLTRFRVDTPADELVVTFGSDGRRDLAVAAQGLFVLLAFSLVLRPPGFTREEGSP